MKRILLLSVLFYSLTALTQTTNYDVFLGDKKVGSVVAVKSSSNGKFSYKTTFKIKIKVIKQYDVKSVTTAVYKNKVLLTSNVKTYDKGILEEEKNIVKSDSTYICIDCKNLPIVSHELIYSNVSKVYFEEPTTNQKVYTERYLGFGTMVSLGNHKYSYKMPNGDTNIYTYINGELESIKVDRMLYKLTFKLIK
jgi:hypothetical protein